MNWSAYDASPEGHVGEPTWTVINLSARSVKDWKFIRGLTEHYAKTLASELNRRDQMAAMLTEVA